MCKTTITAVLFDLDDTLFDHRHSCLAGVRAMREVIGRLHDVSDKKLEETYLFWLERIHKRVLTGELSSDEARIERFTGFFSDFDYELNDDEFLVASEHYSAAYQLEWRTVPGSLEVLEALQGQVKLGIITNNLVEHQITKIQKCNIGHYFDAVTISEEAGACKPEPEIFRIALERLGVKSEEAVMVGDSWESDIVGATSLGIRSVWLNRYGVEIRAEGKAAELHSFQPASAAVEAIFSSPW
ncbi:MAG: HAD family hydrolase [Planctomycetota bacterium]|nr:HAD family hydrolase [Planctomycetota bacterium]MDA1138107.1 HAD family hydrolase [Planctomycetota bacterium]